jgi:hypothetical protein
LIPGLRLALRREAPNPSGVQVRPPCVVNISVVPSGAILTLETAKPGRDDGAGGARHVSLSKGGGAAHRFIFSGLANWRKRSMRILENASAR